MQKPDVKLLLALQVYPGDFDQATELCRLISDIEPRRRRDIEFALFVTREVTQDMIDDLNHILSTKFTFTVIRSKRFGKGWPAGPNDLWQEGMRQMLQTNGIYKKGWTHILTFEPDCIPMRPDWINCLVEECRRMDVQQKDVCGAVCESENPARIHINGNALFRVDIVSRHPILSGAGGPWDFFHRGLLLSLGIDSNFIDQRYGDKETHSVEFFEEIRKNGQRLAFLHGLKDPQNIEAVRQMLKL